MDSPVYILTFFMQTSIRRTRDGGTNLASGVLLLSAAFSGMAVIFAEI